MEFRNRNHSVGVPKVPKSEPFSWSSKLPRSELFRGVPKVPKSEPFNKSFEVRSDSVEFRNQTQTYRDQKFRNKSLVSRLTESYAWVFSLENSLLNGSDFLLPNSLGVFLEQGAFTENVDPQKVPKSSDFGTFRNF